MTSEKQRSIGQLLILAAFILGGVGLVLWSGADGEVRVAGITEERDAFPYLAAWSAAALAAVCGVIFLATAKKD